MSLAIRSVALASLALLVGGGGTAVALSVSDETAACTSAPTTVTTKTITPSAGITVNSSTEAAGVVTVWVSGGVVGAQTVACKITTNAGRTDERTITLVVTDR